MKKLYTLALAAAVALSAAAERQAAVGTVRVATAKAAAIEANLAAPAKMMKAPAKAVAVADLEGDFIWTYDGLLQGQSNGMEGSALIEVTDAAKGLVQITFNEQFTVSATVDAAAGTLTIANNQLVGRDADGDLYFYLKSIDGEGLADGASTAAATVGTISEDLTVTFPASDIWALGDPANENLGWYFLTATNVLSIPVPENWESLSDGKIVENIISPMFVGEATTPVSVEVMRNADKPGVYKVVEPLVGIYTAQNWTGCPDMVIDATDPDNVLVEMTSAGFSTSNNLGAIVYMSHSEYLLLAQGSADGTPAEVRITLKRENGTTTITMPYHSIVYMYAQDTEGKLYYGAPYVSTITFSEPDGAGVEGVTVTEAEGAVEYYNLQGVRLERPAAGVVIRVQGGKATKMLVK